MENNRMIFEAWYGQDISLSYTTWKETTNILPRRCLASGKIIQPLDKVLKGTRRIPNQGYSSGFMPRTETYWMLPEKYILERLKGNL